MVFERGHAWDSVAYGNFHWEFKPFKSENRFIQQINSLQNAVDVFDHVSSYKAKVMTSHSMTMSGVVRSYGIRSTIRSTEYIIQTRTNFC